ncbi:hypothetical protein I7I51_01822 [Histoplasma capsulatum]|uniref:Uncharacterized protein n=1 Tax=Ajellomyces capsulatus TaxID=5037 RepID=A0A8A1MFP9_AJECA|nr:hypothetical protein I7I51_01822 [Histoplasma capsulatum]
MAFLVNCCKSSFIDQDSRQNTRNPRTKKKRYSREGEKNPSEEETDTGREIVCVAEGENNKSRVELINIPGWAKTALLGVGSRLAENNNQVGLLGDPELDKMMQISTRYDERIQQRLLHQRPDAERHAQLLEREKQADRRV